MASHPGAGVFVFHGGGTGTGAPLERPPYMAALRVGTDGMLRSRGHPADSGPARCPAPYGVSRSTSSTGQWSLPVTSLWMI